MRILLHLHKPFFPTVDGGNAASLALYKQLIREGNDVDLMIHDTDKHPFDQSLFSDIKTWTIPTTLATKPIAALKALIKNKSYHTSRFYSDKGAAVIKTCLQKNKYDLVVLDGLYPGVYLKAYRANHNGQIWMRTHNIEHQIWEQEAQKSKGFKSWYLSRLAKQLKQFEEKTLGEMDGLLSISKKDATWLTQNGISSVVHYPFLPEPTNQKYDPLRKDFFHFGAMNWHPNVESYQKLVDELMPRILEIAPKAKLKVAGSFMDEMAAPMQTNIEHLGFVEDLPTFLCASGIMLSPIQSGSGVRVKILEAIAHGTPVVTTPKGAEGIDIANESGIFICETDEDFVQKAIDLYTEFDLRQNASQKALEAFQQLRSKQSLNAIFVNHA